jgi:hypothetical protein
MNEDDESYKAWLSSLKVGDTVMININIGWGKSLLKPYKIDRLTTKQGFIHVKDGVEYKFRLTDGRVLGKRYYHIKQPTEKLIQDYKHHITITKIYHYLDILRNYTDRISPKWVEDNFKTLQEEADRIENALELEKAEARAREQARLDERVRQRERLFGA